MITNEKKYVILPFGMKEKEFSNFHVWYLSKKALSTGKIVQTFHENIGRIDVQVWLDQGLRFSKDDIWDGLGFP